jgi:2,4-dienoyl-CoA reductase-like NADH-dependent reductase (Old Yellow Enzyme family)
MSNDVPHLFRPFVLRELELKNRIVISPMCQNAAGADGAMCDYHLVHLGQFALGGAGLVFVESTAVTPEARINEYDVGLWSDHQIAPLARVAEFLHARGAALGVQLAHAGRKAGAAVLCDGGAPFPCDALTRASGVAFERMGPSAVPAGEDWSIPRLMSIDEIQRARRLFIAAALRAERAGVDVLELHYAHGYLVASYLSPLANFRIDAYGGDFDGRCRLAKEIASDVRTVWPASKPLFCRLSVVDGEENGWSVEDSVRLACQLKAIGVDVIDCSSGGLRDATKTASAPREPGFQTHFAARIRAEADIATQAVGMILTPGQAEAILAEGMADLVALGREALYDPYWPHHAEQALGWDPEFSRWPRYNGAYLAKRRPMMEQLGLTPPPRGYLGET